MQIEHVSCRQHRCDSKAAFIFEGFKVSDMSNAGCASATEKRAVLPVECHSDGARIEPTGACAKHPTARRAFADAHSVTILQVD